MTQPSNAAAQLAALAELHALLEQDSISYWLFGGWAVDFHAGRVTRPHGDIDVAVWLDDAERVAALLRDRGWLHRPEAGEDGYTGYERGAVRLEVAFLAIDEHGRVYTPVQDGRAEWPEGTFGDDVLELQGVRARVIGRGALVAEKSAPRDDPLTAAKDRADVASLTEGRSLARTAPAGIFAAMPTPPPARIPFARALLPVWLFTAAWDFVCASALSVFAYHTPIGRLWRGVAATVLGPSAIDGGATAVAVGLGLHLAVALTWAAIFVAAARAWPALREAIRTPSGALAVAAAYGPVIWLVMSLVVIPLATGRPPAFGFRWWVQIFAHLPFVTAPLVFTARRVLGLAEEPAAVRRAPSMA